MEPDNLSTANVIGTIAKVLLIMAAGLGAIYFLSFLIKPVIDQLADVFSMISGSFGTGRHARSYHDIAVIALLLIAIVGIAKLFSKKR